MTAAPTKIGVGFFGITRSLSFTIDSIRQQILEPAAKIAPVQVFSHFFAQTSIENPRTNEQGHLDPSEHALLNSDWLKLEPPNDCLPVWDFDALCAHGDYWQNDHTSLRNLVHQLHSLRQVTLAMLDAGIEIGLLCRPDLQYHDSFAPALRKALSSGKSGIFIPRWQAWKGGLNDRFALCYGPAALSAYGTRIERALDFCETTRSPLQAEQLVRFVLEQNAIPIHPLGVRASRIRLGGVVEAEDFTIHRLRDLRQSLRLKRRWKAARRAVI